MRGQAVSIQQIGESDVLAPCHMLHAPLPHDPAPCAHAVPAACFQMQRRCRIQLHSPSDSATTTYIQLDVNRSAPATTQSVSPIGKPAQQAQQRSWCEEEQCSRARIRTLLKCFAAVISWQGRHRASALAACSPASASPKYVATVAHARTTPHPQRKANSPKMEKRKLKKPGCSCRRS